MHPDTHQLAAYLDGAVSDAKRMELRAHILTCATCAARLEQLRADGRRITVALSSVAAPDVRAAMRGRLRGSAARAWLVRGLALAVALVGLLLFAVLAGARAGETAGRSPDRLVIIDRSNSQLVALDASSGARLASRKLAEVPNGIEYDEIRDRLYVLLAQSVVAFDLQTLQPAGRWDAPQPFTPVAGMALDSRGARLYIAQPSGVLALALDQPQIAVAQTYDLGQLPGALALAPSGATLYALNAEQARLWTINVINGSARSQALAPSNSRRGYLSVSHDGRFVYVLLTSVGERADLDGERFVDPGRGEGAAQVFGHAEVGEGGGHGAPIDGVVHRRSFRCVHRSSDEGRRLQATGPDVPDGARSPPHGALVVTLP